MPKKLIDPSPDRRYDEVYEDGVKWLSNGLNCGLWPDLDWTKPLCEEFGQRNVEETLIYIAKACSPKGLRVAIMPNLEMVRACLEAVHAEARRKGEAS